MPLAMPFLQRAPSALLRVSSSPSRYFVEQVVVGLRDRLDELLARRSATAPAMSAGTSPGVPLSPMYALLLDAG